MKNLKNIDREIVVIVLLISTIVMLWFAIQIESNNLYQNTISVDNASIEVNKLRLENNELRMIYLEDTSYTHIASVAATQGLVKAPLVGL